MPVPDKQQEVDISNLRLQEEDQSSRASQKNKSERSKPGAPLSQISGVKKPLGHTNSFPGNRLPKYGVESTHESELGEVRIGFTTFWCDD